MNLASDCLEQPHIFQAFDLELHDIYQTSLAMIRRLVCQWEMAVQAIESGDQEAAVKIVARSIDVRNNQDKIDQAILVLLAKETPVGCDLRLVFSLSKIALALKYLGDEINEIGKLSLQLHESRKQATNSNLAIEISRIVHDLGGLLKQLSHILCHLDAETAYELLEQIPQNNKAVQSVIQQLLVSIKTDSQQIKPTLSKLQIVKSIESCNDQCKNLAEYSIFMILGQDIRHTQLGLAASN